MSQRFSSKLKSNYRSSLNRRSSKYNAIKISDKIIITKLKNRLKKEKRKRKYFEKLYNDLKKSNETLYSRLLTKTLSANDLTNTNNENDTSEINQTNINKLIVNRINTNIKNSHLNINTPINANINTNMNVNERYKSISIKFKDEKQSGISSFSPKHNKAFLSQKSKQVQKKRNKSKSITKNYFNITKNINIINKYDKEKNLNSKGYKDPKNISNLKFNISDNSHTDLFSLKEMEQNASFNDNDDEKNKDKNKNKKYKNRLDIKYQ